MTRDSLPADVMAYLADREMDETADYLKRGRRFAALPLEELSHAWTEAFRARLNGESLEGELSNDLQAEHALRDVDLPLASLRADMETFTRNAAGDACVTSSGYPRVRVRVRSRDGYLQMK